MKSRKGAIPVPYIIALILAVAVVAVVGYWFIVSGGKFGGVIAGAECDIMKLRYCQESQIKNWGAPVPASWDTNCGSEPTNTNSGRCAACKNIVGFTGTCPT